MGHPIFRANDDPNSAVSPHKMWQWDIPVPISLLCTQSIDTCPSLCTASILCSTVCYVSIIYWLGIIYTLINLRLYYSETTKINHITASKMWCLIENNSIYWFGMVPEYILETQSKFKLIVNLSIKWSWGIHTQTWAWVLQISEIMNSIYSLLYIH